MLTIRKASLTDCSLINQMAGIVFPATYQELLSTVQLKYMLEWMYSLSSLHKQIKEDGHVYFIAYQDNDPCGYVSVEQQGCDLFHLQKIYVMPEYQGRKIGSFLFEEVINYIKDIHPSPCMMELNVNRENKATAFYKRMGMRILREGDFPIGNGFYMNDYIMGIEI